MAVSRRRLACRPPPPIYERANATVSEGTNLSARVCGRRKSRAATKRCQRTRAVVSTKTCVIARVDRFTFNISDRFEARAHARATCAQFLRNDDQNKPKKLDRRFPVPYATIPAQVDVYQPGAALPAGVRNIHRLAVEEGGRVYKRGKKTRSFLCVLVFTEGASFVKRGLIVGMVFRTGYNSSAALRRNYFLS